MDFIPSQNDAAQYQRPQTRKMSYQTLKQRENAIRAKFAKQWTKDEDEKACFLCRKEFNFLYRRRHHCRKCAKLFCSSCSNYFLSQLIDPSQPIDKDTRLCERCYSECKQFIEMDNKTNDDGNDSISSDDEEEAEQLKIVNKIEYRDQFETKLKNLIRYIFQQEKKLSNVPNFCEQYIDRTFNFTMYCLKNLRSRIRKQEGEKRIEKFHEMDINRYVIIKTSLHKDVNQFSFINGIINCKNVAKKNMCTNFGPKKEVMSSVLSHNQVMRTSNNSSFDGNNQNNNSAQSPLASCVRCMVISIPIDIFSNTDNAYPDLQQIIQKQRLYTQKIVEGIKQFKPQIIFCKENVNQDILQQLEQEKITVVQKIKQNIILKIAECARCLIIDDISIILPNMNAQNAQKISSTYTKNYVGNLHSVCFKTYSFNSKQKTFMFLVQPEKSTAYHVSLLITGPEIEILRQFKKNLQVILRLARHLYLEQEIIYNNNEMIKGNKKAKKLYIQSLESDYVDFGNLNNFIDDKIGLGEYLYSDQAKFTYVKIQYKKVEYDQFDGVHTKEELEKYLTDKKINYENTKVNTLVKYCGEFETEQVSFYQIKDISLAEYLFSIYKERNTACQTCERPMYNHYHLFVRGKCYIKLSIAERIDPNIVKKTTNSIQNRTKTDQGVNIAFQQKAIQQGSSKAQGDEQMKYHQYQNQYQYQSRNPNMRSPQKQQVEGLKKQRIQPKEPVLQYIVCDQCHTNITTVQKSMIGKTLIDYSFNRFLQHMFQEHSEQYKKERQNCLKDIKDIKETNNGLSTMVINKCTHQVRSRIFNIKDVEIKFQVGRTNVYSFNRISFIPESVQNSIKEYDQNYYKDALQNFKVVFKILIADAMARFTKLHDIVYQKKISKQQAFFNIIEIYKICIDRMESEKEHVFSQVDLNNVSNYNSMLLLYILEQRINIGLNRLNCLQKEIIKKKFKQFEKHHLDETIHSDLDNSVLDDDFQELKEIDIANKIKGYFVTLNVQEERLKDDQTQPFEYIPVYSKNQLSLMAWGLNSKQYCRYLKDVGLYGQKVSRATLIEMLKKKNIDPNLDEKQITEENKIVIKVMKSQEMESLVRYDSHFQNIMHRDLEFAKMHSHQDPGVQPRAGSEHHRSQSQNTAITFLNNDTLLSVSTNTNYLNVQQRHHTPQQNNDLSQDPIKSRDDLNKENQDTSNNEDLLLEKEVLNNNDTSNNSGDEQINSKTNIPAPTDPTLPPKKSIKQSNSGVNIRENLNSLFYKNGENKSSQNNLVEFGRAHEMHMTKEHSHSSNNLHTVNATATHPTPTNYTPVHRMTHQSVTSNPYTTTSALHQSLATTIQPELDLTNLYKLTRGENYITNNMTGSGHVEKISEINILFAKQFEAFRNLHGISLERIIESLRTCAVVKLPGGQTQSVFVKSHDELFVVKEVSALEFNYFVSFALEYFDHMSSNPNSLLSKIFGIFVISSEGEKLRHYAVMENLFYGIDRDSCMSYDLKGSKKNRFLKGTDIGLDTNFMIDMNCEPFFIDNSTYQSFDKTIRSDSDFLAQQEIVDYSLLLIVDKNKRTLRLGIIDYFRKYDFYKQMEKKFKELIYREDPTIIEPRKYQERFVRTLTKRFFCKIESK